MKAGTIVKGVVTGIKPYGAFVKVDDDYDGLVHISEFSDGFVKKITDYVKIGDIIELEVISLFDNHKLNLSYKKANQSHKRASIILTKGFSPLEHALPNWIKNYKKTE